MEDNGSYLSTSEKYIQIHRTLLKRKSYLEKAIHTVMTEPPIPGTNQDTIAVSRSSMTYVLERAKDVIDIAKAMNDLINEHNVGLLKPNIPRLIDEETD